MGHSLMSLCQKKTGGYISGFFVLAVNSGHIVSLFHAFSRINDHHGESFVDELVDGVHLKVKFKPYENSRRYILVEKHVLKL